MIAAVIIACLYQLKHYSGNRVVFSPSNDKEIFFSTSVTVTVQCIGGVRSDRLIKVTTMGCYKFDLPRNHGVWTTGPIRNVHVADPCVTSENGGGVDFNPIETDTIVHTGVGHGLGPSMGWVLGLGWVGWRLDCVIFSTS